MPTGRTITAKEAGVFLPGMPVEDKRLGHTGHVIMPGERMIAEPHSDTDVTVLWDHSKKPSWIEQKWLKHL